MILDNIDQNKEKIQSYDSEEDNNSQEDDQPLEISDKDRILNSTSWEPSINELKSLFEDGRLITNPDWQRNFVWDTKKISKLIESILLNIPIPIIYLNEEENGKFTVIDGQQRLTSFIYFVSNKVKLINLQVRADLNGKSFAELSKTEQYKIRDQPIKCIKIDKSSHQDIKFEVFERLNTGSVKLNDDELRNVIFRGPYIDLLKELCENKKFKEMLNNDNYANRMLDRGLVLRFLAFYNKTYLKYKSPIRQFLNTELNDFKNLNETKAKELAKEFKLKFENAIDITYTTFGDKAFRKFERGNEDNPSGSWTKNKINMGLYDVILNSFADVKKSQITPVTDSVRDKLIELMTHDDSFIDSINKATSDAKVVTKRFVIWNEALKLILDDNNIEKRNFDFALRESLFKNDNTCALCHQKILLIEDSEVDHIEPFSLGGKTNLENASLTHRYCNRKKGNRIK